MPNSERLLPVSLHLRNFNKYLTLDLPASQAGNLTLIGENAAGKTTLANCFFPMLIDGSIATPSFNPAKGTDKLDNEKPRNSARDMRTFEGMLLGWGSGAMKSRTGYSYMRMQSGRRQVILGIGAHRAAGDTRRPTWWFVAVSEQTSQTIKIVTTDSAGQSLDKAEFMTANAPLGQQLRVFDQAVDYRDYVALKVYGFTDTASLSKLVTVYRLLASPILTAGNARFTPIKEALKNAQEGIDPQVMINVAATQRDVNQMNGLQQRLKRAQERLHRLKKVIFWGNLNHLQELLIDPYNSSHAAFEKKRAACEQEQQQITAYEHQLELLANSLIKANSAVERLKEEQLKQRSIQSQRKTDQHLIEELNLRLADYHQNQKMIASIQKDLANLEKQKVAMVAQRQEIRDQELRPLLAQLAGKAEILHGLIAILGESQIIKVHAGLATYLKSYEKAQNQYLSYQRELHQIGQAVNIVTDMKNELDTRIDRRVTGALVNRFKDGLHQDNHEVHDAGAAKMSQHFKELSTKLEKLLSDLPDLDQLLADDQLFDFLLKSSHELGDFQNKLQGCDQSLNDSDKHSAIKQEQLEQNQSRIDPNFDESSLIDEINDLQTQVDAMIVDPQIDQKVIDATQVRTKLDNEKSQLNAQKAEQLGRLKTDSADQKNYQSELTKIRQQLMTAIKTLQAYAPVPDDLSSVTAVISFGQHNRAEIRNNDYSQIAAQIGHLIHNNNHDGIDKNALDDIFDERGHSTEASAMRQQRSVALGDLIVVAFDLNHAIELIDVDQKAVGKSLQELKSGNDFAQTTYLSAATQRITAQYKLIENYNQMLTAGIGREQSIKLKVALTPVAVSPEVIVEARNPSLADQRPRLRAEIQKRLEKLANDTTVADDETAFMLEAQQLLDTRQWSEFQVLIKRRQSAEDDYEIVDDKFVQSGGSGAEKAQAMVLPLLLVPKMVLQQATMDDAPYLVMFDEFADKLDPETAKSFAKTIARFGFNFIATMPEGAQNKILADGVANVAYDVIAAKNQADGRFHPNTVTPALIWQKEMPK